MRIAKCLAPTLIFLTVSTVLAAAPASADPATPPALQITGTDQNVAYTAALTDDHRAAITTLQAGQFRIYLLTVIASHCLTALYGPSPWRSSSPM
ncbi:hypothetical protein ACFXG4_23850 [Nocardia sp. NPDC059246]|uniref:hypothetical protein n=1 Tax=unclassified Nocardia TaxID=2637762 RepID=UPI0036A26E75